MTNMVIDKVNKGTGTTVLNSNTSRKQVLWNQVLLVQATTKREIGVRGISAQTDSPGGIGVSGYAAAATNSGAGVFGGAASPNGTGVIGHALSISTNVGNGVGVNGSSDWTNGIGVQGFAASGLGSNIGVQGSSGSPSGIGVEGVAAAAGTIPIVAKGAASQTASLQEWQNSAGSALSVVDKNGRFGIGMSSPGHLIQLAGGAYCDGTGGWIAGSSVRWKENISPLVDAVSTLCQLHPVIYNRKETPGKMKMGFIAEEVGKVLPTVVDWDEKEPGYAEGYDHQAILALAVEAIREQQKTIEQLQHRINLLEDRAIMVHPELVQ